MTSYGTYLSAAGIRNNSHRIDQISNNLANVETAGFKRALAEITERPAEASHARSDLKRVGDAIGGAPMVRDTLFDRAQGAFEPTGNPLDIALRGDGYLVVRQGEDGRGGVKLTRDGSLMVGDDGLLRTQHGHAVLGPDGRPVDLGGFPQRDLRVDATGTVSYFNQPLGTVAVMTAADPEAVRPTGGNLFTAGTDDFDDLVPATASVEGGLIERSNASPEIELIRLLDAQRQLETNARMLQFQDEATGKLVNTVGRIA